MTITFADGTGRHAEDREIVGCLREKPLHAISASGLGMPAISRPRGVAGSFPARTVSSWLCSPNGYSQMAWKFALREVWS